MVNSPCILADVGCDHALLPIALVESGKCSKAYACDVNRGPLERGKEAIKNANLENKINTILTNGLHNIPDDITCVTIAGMGYDTMVAILENDLDKAYACKQLVLQSNNHIYELRKWLMNHDFTIDSEDLVYEQHYYHILSVHYEKSSMSEDTLYFGEYLSNHPLCIPYWEHILNKKRLILNQLDPQHIQYQLTSKEIEKIENYINKVK